VCTYYFRGYKKQYLIYCQFPHYLSLSSTAIFGKLVLAFTTLFRRLNSWLLADSRALRSRRLEVAAVLVAAVVVVGEAEILFFAVARLLRRGPLQQQVVGFGQRWQIVWKMVRLTFWTKIRHVYSRYSSIWVWLLSIYSILKPILKYSKSLIPKLKTQTQILKKYLSILCFSKCFVFFAN